MNKILLITILSSCTTNNYADEIKPDASSPPSCQEAPRTACANAGRWGGDVLCWSDLPSTRFIEVTVAGGVVSLGNVIDSAGKFYNYPSGGNVYVDQDGSCRVDVTFGNYSISLYPHEGLTITGNGTVGALVCEILAHRQN